MKVELDNSDASWLESGIAPHRTCPGLSTPYQPSGRCTLFHTELFQLEGVHIELDPRKSIEGKVIG